MPWREIKSLMLLSTKNWRIPATFDHLQQFFAKSFVQKDGRENSVSLCRWMERLVFQIRRKTGNAFLMQDIWHLFLGFCARPHAPSGRSDGLDARDLPQNPMGNGATALSHGKCSICDLGVASEAKALLYLSRRQPKPVMCLKALLGGPN